MVFVNTCADSLVNGTIRIVDLLPDCMCSTILEVFRKKFFCEFIPNETEKTIDIKLFKECIKQNPTCDLSPYLIGHPEISFPESYKQLILSSENSLSDANSVSSEKSLSDLAAKYSTVEYDKATGDFLPMRIYVLWPYDLPAILFSGSRKSIPILHEILCRWRFGN